MTSSDLPNPHPAFSRLWPWLAAVSSGVLLTLCFPPYDQGWMAWIALMPLIGAAFAPGSRWRRAVLGYVAGFIFFASVFWWLSSLADLYRNPWLLTLPLLLALYMGLYFGFWTWFLGEVLAALDPDRTFNRSLRNLALGALGASAWVAHEWMREWLFGGFGWNPLGVALHHDLAMIQIAEITGTPGLSWLVAFANLMGVIIVRRIVGELGPNFSRRIRWEFSLTMALIALVFAFGIRRLLHPEPAETVPLRVVAVQPNIPQTDKFDREADQRVMEQIGQLTELAVLGKPAPQLVVWPESAVPAGMFASEENFHFVMDIAQQGDFSLLLGSVDFDPTKQEDYNTALLLTGHGTGQQSYRKMHLVPFGEYLPLRPIFGHFLGALVPGDFTPGREYTLLHLPDPPTELGALVCFEDTLGELTRHFVQNGAQMLVNITNDGWFAKTAAADQHIANAMFRAVENRRPLIRCTNTGVTAEILPSGQVDAWLPPFQQGFVAREVQVPVHARLTFYTRHGNWLSIVAMGLTFAALAFAFVRRLRTAAAE
ncbi:apolipoprotein N-acyltransferase [Chthoniobacter flavus Ellin428]|uniref:Apolipoprotein N-acyltransferase n=1 Tax=Chthoniobacter flavus Ellin428 TaxID=497964 RepID=B4CYZ3_9BACT|nr:apolipoprotein N-acyltransferase [Chthoniobacter flavus]EDY20684.1 apolipoprotein N-acyltransferase [Chthoniobacter flavus Ellin428]TCO89583.1 apolipoprotein N-acyltransferase [Chthoniobacter flavus]